MKKIISLIMFLLVGITLTGCGSKEINNNTNNNNQNINEDNTQSNITYYKTVKVTEYNGYTLMQGLSSFGYLNGAGEAKYSDDGIWLYSEYGNSLVLQYDTKTGKCISANLELYVTEKDIADEIVSNMKGDSELAEKISDEKVEKVKDDVYVVKAEVDISKYVTEFDQYINTYLIPVQRIEDYKNATHYDNLSNYTDPANNIYVEDTEGHFFSTIANFSLDWE